MLTVPFPFVNCSKWPWSNAGVQNHLAGINLPVVARVSLLPGPLKGKELQFRYTYYAPKNAFKTIFDIDIKIKKKYWSEKRKQNNHLVFHP